MKPALQKSPISESQAFEVKYLNEPHFDSNWHFHSEYQLFTVIRGTGTRFVGDHVSPFKKNDLVFTGPNLPTYGKVILNISMVTKIYGQKAWLYISTKILLEMIFCTKMRLIESSNYF